ncbi:MAG: oligosaccharide flippase family protein, partial [Euryarchaeota archaeon]|nr:oligosaccharide flippase family protein [Euryarchaeota archaeon]
TTLISQTLNTSAARFAAELVARGHSLGRFLRGGIWRMVLLGFASAGITLLLLNPLSRMLKISEREPVLVLAVLLFLLWLRPITEGVLRGLQRFGALSLLLISSSAARFATGVPLVVMGAGVAGALAGVAFGQIVPVVAALLLLRGHLRSATESSFSFTSFYSYSLPVLIAMLCFSVPANLDVVLAKYFFSAREAGIYTSASVLGKISFFFPSAIYAVMFPMIADAH